MCVRIYRWKNLLNFQDISVSVISVGVSISVISSRDEEKKELDLGIWDLCEGHGDDPHTSLDVLQDFDWFFIDFLMFYKKFRKNASEDKSSVLGSCSF